MLSDVMMTLGMWTLLVMFRYGVVIDGERGNRPNIMAQLDLLSHTVRRFSVVVFFLRTYCQIDNSALHSFDTVSNSSNSFSECNLRSLLHCFFHWPCSDSSR